MAKAHPLLRFLNKESGPIVRLSTYNEGSVNSPIWYSVAELSPDIVGEYRKNDVLKLGGGGWANSRQLSQEKAITEAIERWAFCFYQNADHIEAGLNLDNTSNGFSAMPHEYGARGALFNSGCEALERYILNQFWMNATIKFEEVHTDVALSIPVKNLFLTEPGYLKLFKFVVHIPKDSWLTTQLNFGNEVVFCLVVFNRLNSGVVPGSAVGADLIQVCNRAALEAWNHIRALRSIEQGLKSASSTITDQRLIWFGQNSEAQYLVRQVIDRNIATECSLEIPVGQLCKRLPGPWEPEIIVTRVVVSDSPPITVGDYKRFLI